MISDSSSHLASILKVRRARTRDATAFVTSVPVGAAQCSGASARRQSRRPNRRWHRLGQRKTRFQRLRLSPQSYRRRCKRWYEPSWGTHVQRKLGSSICGSECHRRSTRCFQNLKRALMRRWRPLRSTKPSYARWWRKLPASPKIMSCQNRGRPRPARMAGCSARFMR